MDIKGVNLGNWLVLEKWMNPLMFEGTTAEDEYYLPRHLSSEVYQERIRRHRLEYITERDFVRIHSMGFNTVRIPVPYFIFGDRAPFVGCVEELDKAFDWAEKQNLKILIDLHTVPDSQNGFDNGGISGVCKWSKEPEEVEFALQVLEKLAARYGERKTLWGIEPLNEPVLEDTWAFLNVQLRYPPADPEKAEGTGPATMAFIQNFYRDAYRRLRANMPKDKYVVFHDAFHLKDWKVFLETEAMENVVLDTHQYLMVAEAKGCEKSIEGYETYIREQLGEKIEEVQKYCQVICGEWCLFNSMAIGKTPEEKKEIYQAVAKAQLEAWKKGSGYFYWSYKLLTDTVHDENFEGWDSWDLARCVEEDWLPMQWIKESGEAV